MDSAVKAKIRKIVLVSIANASADSPFRYYKGKAEIEKIVRDNNHMRLMCGAPDELRLIVAAIDRHTDAEGA